MAAKFAQAQEEAKKKKEAEAKAAKEGHAIDHAHVHSMHNVHDEGDHRFYTKAALKKRSKLRNNKRVRHLIREFWEVKRYLTERSAASDL